MPGYPCCCTPPHPCSECDSDEYPATITVGLNGLLDDSCTDCTNLDGSYTLDYGVRPAFGSGGYCTWGAEFSISGVQYDWHPIIGLCKTANRLIIEARLYTLSGAGSNTFEVLFYLTDSASGTLVGQTWSVAVFRETGFPSTCCMWTGELVDFSHQSRLPPNGTSTDCDWSVALVDVTSGGDGWCP